MTIRESVREFIVRAFHAPADLSDDASLFEAGIIGLDAVSEVIMWLEESYILQVEDRDMKPENFESIAQLAAFVDRKLGELETTRMRTEWFAEDAA
jgi:acyl carrier protein